MAVEAFAARTGTVESSFVLATVWATRLPFARDKESIKTEVDSNSWRHGRLYRKNIISSSSVDQFYKVKSKPARNRSMQAFERTTGGKPVWLAVIGSQSRSP